MSYPHPPGDGWLPYLVALAAAGIGWLAKSLMPMWSKRAESAIARETREQEAEERERKRLQDAADSAAQMAREETAKHFATITQQNKDQQGQINGLLSEMRQLRDGHHECETRNASQAVVIGNQSGKISVLEAQVASANSRIASMTSLLEKLRVRDTVIRPE